MTTAGRLQQIIAQYRQQLEDHEAHAIKTLESMYAHSLKVVQTRLASIYQHIEEAAQNGETVPVSWLYEQNRLTLLKDFILSQMQTYAHFVEQQVTNLQTHASSAGVQSAYEQLKAMTPKGITWTWGMPAPSAIVSMVGATSKGSPLRELFQGFGEEAAANVTNALVTAVTLGHNPRVTAQSVQDALDISRSRALTICRTEQIRSYRMGNLATMQENSNALDGWAWMASLSGRTCPACIAMNGTEHPLSEEMGSHPNCRCTMSPKTKSWEDILGPLGIDTSNIPDTRPYIPDGVDWFGEQNADTQRAILGNAKYEAWQNGDFDFGDVVGTSHDPDWGKSIYVKSLKQLTA